MKPGFFRIASLSLLIILVLITVPVTNSYAQTPTDVPTETPTPVLDSVTPLSIVNDVQNTITISGSGFNNTAVVQLAGIALDTNFRNARTLTAIVPAGFTAGSPQITVSMDGITLTGPTLTVNDPPPTAVPVDTDTPGPVVRPQIGVVTYKTSPSPVQYGQNFKLVVKLRNEGHAQAYNVQAVFTSTDYLPTKNGGVEIIGDLAAGNAVTIDQSMVVGNYSSGFVSVNMDLSYSDASGTAYTEKFSLNLSGIGGGSGGSYATSTPTGVKSSQLVITSYAASF